MGNLLLMVQKGGRETEKEESELKRYFQVTINFTLLLIILIFGAKASAETLLERGTRRVK
jgi:hypothetical protein